MKEGRKGKKGGEGGGGRHSLTNLYALAGFERTLLLVGKGKKGRREKGVTFRRDVGGKGKLPLFIFL